MESSWWMESAYTPIFSYTATGGHLSVYYRTQRRVLQGAVEIWASKMDPRQGNGQTPSGRQLRLSALWTWRTFLHWQTGCRGADAILHIKGACAFILPPHPTPFPNHSVLLTLFFSIPPLTRPSFPLCRWYSSFTFYRPAIKRWILDCVW